MHFHWPCTLQEPIQIKCENNQTYCGIYRGQICKPVCFQQQPIGQETRIWSLVSVFFFSRVSHSPIDGQLINLYPQVDEASGWLQIYRTDAAGIVQSLHGKARLVNSCQIKESSLMVIPPDPLHPPTFSWWSCIFVNGCTQLLSSRVCIGCQWNLKAKMERSVSKWQEKVSHNSANYSTCPVKEIQTWTGCCVWFSWF